jgi:class 3 adenylate cyclase/TolB-like protein/Tfp pilus assembly protein PilF
MDTVVPPNLSGTTAPVRRLAAILAADVAGYSRLMGADETGTLQALKSHRTRIFEPAVTQHNGRIVKTTGDGFLIEFASAVDAVDCAVGIQRRMAALNATVAPGQRLVFRIGINVGDIIVDEHDIYGDGVNVAARLEAMAEPGGISVSRAVRDPVFDKVAYAFDDLGDVQAKNIARPIRVFRVSYDSLRIKRDAPNIWRHLPRSAVVFGCGVGVSVVAALLWHFYLRTPDPGARSIAVLPFASLSADPEQGYMAAAITADLTTDLSRIAGIAVIANSSASVYSKSVDVRQVGRELAVAYVIEGSVRGTGDQIEVNASLIDTRTGVQRWADRFETDQRNIAQAQADITSRLARTLNLRLIEEQTHRPEQRRQIDPNARELMMRGWALWYRPYTPANRREALTSFQQALRIDPQSVEAHIGAAMTLAMNVGTGLSQDRDHDIAHADGLVDAALALDANSSQAHEVRGMVRRLQGRLDDSAAEFETAIALDRNNAHAIFSLGQDRMYQGQPELALTLMAQAHRLNPRDPNLAFDDWARGACALLLGRVDDAVSHLRSATDRNPRVYFFQLYLAAALGLKGDIDGAKAALDAASRLAPEVDTIAKWRTMQPSIADPRHWKLFENTGLVGLHRAGMPDG